MNIAKLFGFEKKKKNNPMEQSSILPKNGKKIIKVLKESEGMTQKELILSLPKIKPRAVRYTVRKLANMNILIKQGYFEDMRQTVFRLNPEIDTVIKDIEKETNLKR